MTRRRPLVSTAFTALRSALAPLAAAAALAAAAGGFAPAAARAGVTSFQIGQQDFAHGTTNVSHAAIKSAGAGEAYPFDGTIFGDDRKAGALGSVTYTHAFDPAAVTGGAGEIRSATLTLGLIDVDAPRSAPASVRLLLNGVAQPLSLLQGISSGSAPSSAEVVTVNVPAALLAAGKLTVQLQAVRRAPGFLGNAIEVDFSRLAVDATFARPPGNGSGGQGGSGGTGDGGSSGGGGGTVPPDGAAGGVSPDPAAGHGHTPPAAVPLPPAVFPAGAALLGLAAAQWRKRRGRRA